MLKAAPLHWRATTHQNAADISQEIIKQIQTGEITPTEGENIYHFMIIAEQPYSERMSMQVQRAFNQAIKSNNLQITIIVEGCGQGIEKKVVEAPSENKAILARMNSALGALMAERYNDAKLQNSNLDQRNSNGIMFSKRDKYYENLLAEQKQALQINGCG